SALHTTPLDAERRRPSIRTTLGAFASTRLERSADRPTRLVLTTSSRPDGVGDRLAARLRAELSEDRVHVELRGVLADSEPLADAPIREALGEELEHLALAGGERLDERLARDPRAHHGFVEGVVHDAQAQRHRLDGRQQLLL